MFDHVSIGVSDLARAKAFYDAALAPLGCTCLYADDGSLGYGAKKPEFWLLERQTPVPRDAHSGLHFCFEAPDQASVTAFHAAALATGGADNGAPGIRESYGPTYFAAFVVDPDGYRLEAHTGGH